jgi:hypothetical protein
MQIAATGIERETRENHPGIDPPGQPGRKKPEADEILDNPGIKRTSVTQNMQNKGLLDENRIGRI